MQQVRYQSIDWSNDRINVKMHEICAQVEDSIRQAEDSIVLSRTGKRRVIKFDHRCHDSRLEQKRHRGNDVGHAYQTAPSLCSLEFKAPKVNETRKRFKTRAAALRIPVQAGTETLSQPRALLRD